MKSWSFDSPDPERTFAVARELGRSIGVDGLVIALVGPLGSGKTVFVKGLAAGLGLPPEIVSSPTFVIAHEHPLAGRPETLHHVDLYRLESVRELESIGFDEMFETGRVLAIEWADRFPDLLGREFLSIRFAGPSAEEAAAAREGAAWRGRRVRLTASGQAAEGILEDWADRVGRMGSPNDERADRDRPEPESGAGRVVSSPDARRLLLLLLAMGLLVAGRTGLVAGRTSCGSLAGIDSDGLGTRLARCGASPSERDRHPLTGIARWLDGKKVDPNRAPPELLVQLPGIGPARARAIVRARNAAPFGSVHDLERVSGIGPATRSRLERWLAVGEDAGDAEPRSPSRPARDG